MITTLSQLIEQVESNGNPFAVRYEIAYTPKRIGEMVKLCRCTQSTAAVLCASSFGLYQMMGDTLIDLGLKVTPIAFCGNVAMQEELFNRFVINNHINFSIDELTKVELKRIAFARRYNGPENITAYCERMLSFLEPVTA